MLRIGLKGTILLWISGIPYTLVIMIPVGQMWLSPLYLFTPTVSGCWIKVDASDASYSPL